jgi:4-hydroxy-tetrahydrodipicolinate synthase
LNEKSLRGSIAFLLDRGIRRFALNGATAEYCTVTPAELSRILAIAREMLPSDAKFICGIGSASLHGCEASGAAAIEAGAAALLLPMPHFFPYQQEDLIEFCRTAAAHLPAPILLYNLPQFTTGLEPPTVLRLLQQCPNIIGIKDSSGKLDILQELDPSHCRMVGNDSVLASALRDRVCDGVISGVACVLPELLLSLYAERSSTQSPTFLRAEEALKEFIGKISGFPVPWGLKWIAEARGIAPASFSQPVSEARLTQARELQSWFHQWHSELLTRSESVGQRG